VLENFLQSCLISQLAWALGAVLGLGAALLDLHSSTRWPYAISMFGIALLLTLIEPKWPWRCLCWLHWFCLHSCCSPTTGAYQIDRSDVFYGLVPAALGALLGLGARRLAHIHRQPPARGNSTF